MNGRSIIAAIGLAAIILAIWGLLHFSGDGGGELGPRTKEVVETETAPAPLPRRVVGEAPSVDPGPGLQLEVVAGVEADRVEDLLTVEIVSGRDGKPVVDAELFVCEPGRFDSFRDRARCRIAEPRLRARFRSVASDTDGTCRIPRPPPHTRLFAFSPTSSGMITLEGPPRERQRLVVDRDDQTLTVRTRAADGRLVGGIPVLLVRAHSKNSGEFIGRSSERDGTIPVPWPDRHLRDEDWVVAVGGALLRDVEARIDFAAGADQLIELQLPAFGSLELDLLTADGEPVDFPLQVGFRTAERLSFRSVHEWTDGGRCRVAPIQVGAKVEFWYTPRDQSDCRTGRAILDGPRFAGETIFHRHRIDPWASRLRFRVLDTDGEIMAGRSLRARLRPPDGNISSSRTLTTDEEGRTGFGFDFDPNGAWLRVEERFRGDLIATAFRTLPDPAPGPVIDLGDLVLEPPPIVAAGRVVDRAGRPVPLATLQLSRVSKGKTRPGSIDAGRRADEEGRFEVRSRDREGELLLTVRAGGKAPKTVAVRAGTTDLEVVMADASRIEGRLVLPEGTSVGDFRMEVETVEGRTSSIHIKKDGSFTSYWLDAEIRAIRVHPRDRKQTAQQLIARDLVLKTGDLVDLGTIAVHLSPRTEDAR